MAKTNDWRHSVSPTDDVFMYQGDLYCHSDGEAIKAEITEAGNAPDDPSNESSYDSDDFPKGPFSDDEADSPGHCGAGEDCLEAITLPYGGKIGAWLGNELTDEGVARTCEMVIDDLDRTHENAMQVGRLWAYLYRDQLDCGLVELKGKRRASRSSGSQAYTHSVVESIMAIWSAPSRVLKAMFADTNAVYALGAYDDNLVIERYGAKPDGSFAEAEVVTIPYQEAEARFAGMDYDKIVAEVADEEGWR